VARRSVISSVSTDRVRDCLTYPVLRLLRVDTGAIVVCEAGIAAVAIARHGDHALAPSAREGLIVEKRLCQLRTGC